ncbi:hypothetical protein B0H15DRAFT_856913 [Mycena belliarum]|uniref:Uncharacterized protein n=1 Tax=Mycena belliarum TaxID=1033014 RepID=A0AAD6TUQ5_9AGAR|nr:hypothetical protein B0H15DRAFT_856913 [Mycena belliae]
MANQFSQERCPTCQEHFITRPTKCAGKFTVANLGRVYQKCPQHIFNDPTSPCDFFLWRDDLSPPPWGDVEPEESPGGRRRIPCTSARCLSAAKPRALRQDCSQSFCKECCVASSLICRVKDHNPNILPSSLILPSPSTAVAGPAGFSGPYATMIAPAYAEKIATNNFAIALSSRTQTEAYRMESQHTVKVKFWVKNNERPLIFNVPVTSYPFFHPKDYEVITTRVGLPCTSYDFLDTVAHPLDSTAGDEDEWITTSMPTRVKPDMTLYMRTPDVNTFLGLRSESPRKRPLSPAPDGPRSSPSPSLPSTPSPKKRVRSKEPVFV